MIKFNKFGVIQDRLDSLQESVQKLEEQLNLLNNISSQNAQPRGALLLKSLGVSPARFLDRFFESAPENDYYEALYGGSDSLRGSPAYIGLRSSLCRQIHFSMDEFRFWMGAMGRRPRMHRKDWEWFFIAQALFEHGYLSKAKRGLAFAVGREPLPALFATFGCQILATDQAPDKAAESGWATTNMHSAQVEALFDEAICPRDVFFSSVEYANADMNDIPDDLNGRFDFCWSSCAFEHLGSLEHGMRFVERSLDSLVPGGIAIHTTEYNLSSNDTTIETPGLSIYRKRDVEALVERLSASGHQVAPLDLTTSHGFAEAVVDLPPYKQSPHLKLRIGEYDCTSLALIIQKVGA